MAAKTGKADIAALLEACRQGDEGARSRLLELLYDELMSIASLLLKREERNISLLTGDLVNEAIVRLLQTATLNVKDKNHLLALSARVMRHVLVDAAKSKERDKRKGINVTLTQSNIDPGAADIDVLLLERALMRLSAIDPARAEIVEMRYFAGMTVDEIADVKDVSPATVRRMWRAARLWLKNAMKNDF